MASAAPAQQEIQPLTGARLFLGAFALALANFVVVLDTTIANVSVPHIAGGLAVSPTQGTWAITSYAVADAISVPLTGWYSSRFGSVRWFLVSLTGFAIFSFLCGISSSLGMLVFFRVLQGFSGGPLMPLSQTLLLRIFPKEKATMGLAIWASTTTAAPILGPILGGWISDNWTWPWIFFINLPVVAICWFLVRSMISRYETPIQKRPIDYIGLVLLVVSVGAFQIMLDTGREHDWFGSSWIVLLAIIAVVGFGALIIWELTEKHPIVDIRVFRHRGFSIATLAIALGFGAFFAQVVLTPLWLQQTLGYTATNAGYVVAWIGLFAVLGSPFVARLMGKVDVRILVSLGLIWMLAMSFLRARWTTDSDYWQLALPHLAQGFAMPMFFMGLTALALGNVKPQETVSAAGLMSFCRTLSGAIGTALATTASEDASRAAHSQLAGLLNAPQATLDAMQRAGLSADQARGALDRLVEAQASTLGVAHVYLLAGGVFAFAAGAIWFAPKPKPGAGMGGGGH
jgi:MFS transporter, DHA2 family, multidrug resistance protein